MIMKSLPAKNLLPNLKLNYSPFHNSVHILLDLVYSVRQFYVYLHNALIYILLPSPAKTFTISNLWIESLPLDCNLQNPSLCFASSPRRKVVGLTEKKCFQCLSKLVKLSQSCLKECHSKGNRWNAQWYLQNLRGKFIKARKQKKQTRIKDCSESEKLKFKS